MKEPTPEEIANIVDNMIVAFGVPVDPPTTTPAPSARSTGGANSSGGSSGFERRSSWMDQVGGRKKAR